MNESRNWKAVTEVHRVKVHRRRRAGQAMAELALSLPLLLGVLFIIIETTFAISSAATLHDAVHYGARILAQKDLTHEQTKAKVRDFLRNDRFIEIEKVKIRIREGTDFNGKDNVTVEAFLPVRPVTFTSMTEFNLRAKAVFRKEHRPPA